MIFNIGAGKSYVLPVLSASYPANVSFMENANGSATFKVVIESAGKPAEYTYQWYLNGVKINGATSSSYTRTGLTSAANYSVYCKVTNAAGTVTSRTATLKVTSSQPVYTFSGDAVLTRQNSYDWMLTFKTSGTLRFSSLGNCAGKADVFCVGGGGGGGAYSRSYYGGGGGGGGSAVTSKGKSIAINTDYVITIGSGGAASSAGGNTSALGVSAAGGGTGGDYGYGGNGGSGGGAGGYSSTKAGGNGGSNGSDGTANTANAQGKGEGTSTRAFGESGGTLYAGGGGGGSGISSSGSTSAAGSGGAGGGAAGNGNNASNNTGGGGGGAKAKTGSGGKGGSGIVLIRNAR